MNEEVLRIQRMVAEGKVSAEEGVELIEALRSPTVSDSSTPREASSPVATAAQGNSPVHTATKEKTRRFRTGFWFMLPINAIALISSAAAGCVPIILISCLGLVACAIGLTLTRTSQ